MAEPATRRLSFAEYLAAERDSEAKHEFVDGEMIAMSGGSLPHGELTARTTAQLVLALGDKPCRAFSSDVRVRVPSGRAFYPDVSVVCGPVETDPEDDFTITNPSLVVEVLSPTTEAYNRGDKFAAYQELPSLRHHVLVSQHEARIEHYARDDDGTWRYSAHGPGDRLVALGVSIAVDDVYRNVDLATRPPRLRRS